MDPNEQARQMLHHMGPAIFLFWGFVFLIKATLYVIPLFQTCKKSGLNPAIAFLAFVPLIGRLLAMYVISFSEWRVAPMQPIAYNPAAYPPQYPPPPPAQY